MLSGVGLSHPCLAGRWLGRSCCCLLARPRLREELPHGQGASLHEPCCDKQDPPSKTTELALRWEFGCTAPGHMRWWQRFQTARRQPGIGLSPATFHPQRCHCHRQPQPTGPRRVGHLGLVPRPSAALTILEPRFNPGSQTVPGHLCLLWQEISQHQPAVMMPWLPTG
jgi:hypothetical protein